MAATESAALIAELEGALDSRLPERWARILRQVTQLFLADAHRFNEAQIAVFDDVFLRLMKRADAQALARLAIAAVDCDRRGHGSGPVRFPPP